MIFHETETFRQFSSSLFIKQKPPAQNHDQLHWSTISSSSVSSASQHHLLAWVHQPELEYHQCTIIYGTASVWVFSSSHLDVALWCSCCWFIIHSWIFCWNLNSSCMTLSGIGGDWNRVSQLSLPAVWFLVHLKLRHHMLVISSIQWTLTSWTVLPYMEESMWPKKI